MGWQDECLVMGELRSQVHPVMLPVDYAIDDPRCL